MSNKMNVFKEVKVLKDSISHLDKACAETIALSHGLLADDIRNANSEISRVEALAESALKLVKSTNKKVILLGLVCGYGLYKCWRLENEISMLRTDIKVLKRNTAETESKKDVWEEDEF